MKKLLLLALAALLALPSIAAEQLPPRKKLLRLLSKSTIITSKNIRTHCSAFLIIPARRSMKPISGPALSISKV